MLHPSNMRGGNVVSSERIKNTGGEMQRRKKKKNPLLFSSLVESRFDILGMGFDVKYINIFNFINDISSSTRYYFCSRMLTLILSFASIGEFR